MQKPKVIRYTLAYYYHKANLIKPVRNFFPENALA